VHRFVGGSFLAAVAWISLSGAAAAQEASPPTTVDVELTVDSEEVDTPDRADNDDDSDKTGLWGLLGLLGLAGLAGLAKKRKDTDTTTAPRTTGPPPTGATGTDTTVR
jgi:MYXO-CTERM domain-containing protein